MTGLKLEDVLEHGPGTGYIAQREVEVERSLLQLARNFRVLEEGLDLGCEGEKITALVDVKRLDSQPVAREQEPLLAPVPDCEGKHPAQVCNAVVSMLLVCVQDHLGVGARSKSVSQRDELFAQVEKVVDLSVENDH